VTGTLIVMMEQMKSDVSTKLTALENVKKAHLHVTIKRNALTLAGFATVMQIVLMAVTNPTRFV